MRDVIVAGTLAFVAVLAVAAWARPASVPEASPTSEISGLVVKCAAPLPDCQELAARFAARARAANPGRTLISVTVLGPSSFEACFAEGICHGEALVDPKGPPQPPDAAP